MATAVQTSLVDVVVIRGEGDKCGDTIVEPLLVNESVALYRGVQEMDDTAQEYMAVDLTAIYKPNLAVSDKIKVSEQLNRPYLYSKVTDITYNVDTTGVTVNLNMRRPLEQ